MGSQVEINDTLNITSEQGFPAELDINQHLSTPYKLDDIKGKIFKFKNKDSIRVYKVPPVRNFLVENIGGKWVYWGLCHILSIEHDYLNKITGGTFKIIYLNSPEEMKQVFDLTDQRPDHNYFV